MLFNGLSSITIISYFSAQIALDLAHASPSPCLLGPLTAQHPSLSTSSHQAHLYSPFLRESWALPPLCSQLLTTPFRGSGASVQILVGWSGCLSDSPCLWNADCGLETCMFPFSGLEHDQVQINSSLMKMPKETMQTSCWPQHIRAWHNLLHRVGSWTWVMTSSLLKYTFPAWWALTKGSLPAFPFALRAGAS